MELFSQTMDFQATKILLKLSNKVKSNPFKWVQMALKVKN